MTREELLDPYKRDQRARKYLRTKEALLDPYKRDQCACKYLRTKEQPPTRGNIRGGIAFAFLAIVVIIILLAL